MALAGLTLLAGVSAGLAAPGAFVRFAGGGAARTDCMLVTDVAGAAAVRRTARCTDGDPACDADGAANGTCTFQVRLCLDVHDETASRCGPDVITHAELTADPAVFGGLASALAATPMPVTMPGSCTDVTTAPVARAGRRVARAVLRAAARMASGHADRDRVTLVCRGAPVATFATLGRKIFSPSCATASCHGAGRAGGLGLLADEAYANLVGVLAANPAARAAGVLRVAPGDPAASFLVRKLTGELSPTEGEPMPRAGSSPPRAQIDLVRRWIAAGAPADAPF